MTWHSRLYVQTLKSPRWRRLRQRIYRWRARGRCEGCRRRFPLSALQLHHIDYRRLGWERWRDVALLCVPCHRRADAVRRGRL